MNIKFFFIMVFSAISRRKTAAVTALLSAAVAAAITLYMAALKVEAPARFARELRSYGANLIVTGVITPEKYAELVNILNEYGERFVGAAPFLYSDAWLNEISVTLVKTSFREALKTNPHWQFAANEEEDVLLGSDIASAAGLEKGDKILLNGAARSVTGILKTGGAGDMYVYAEFAEDETPELVEVSIALESGELILLIDRLKGITGLKAGKVARITGSENRVMEKLSMFLTLVALFTLLLTVISAAAATSQSIFARQEEIALKKALGGATLMVAVEFLCEAAVTGLLGSVLGASAGTWFFVKTSEKLFEAAVNIPIYLYPTAVLAVVFLITLAALIPIRRIVTIEPAAALKGQ